MKITSRFLSALALAATACGSYPTHAQQATQQNETSKTLAMGNEKADPAAYAMLKAASESRQVMPDTFPGFSAKLIFRTDNKAHEGKVNYARGAAVTIEMTGLSDDERAWLEDQVGSIIGHRRGGDFASGDGRYPLRFGEAPENNFGKLIELGDRLNSSYRVRDNRVREVTRQMGNTRFTISVVDTMEADAGKYLSTRFMVSYRDKTSGALQEVEAFDDHYAPVKNVWLPVSRQVTTFDKETTPHTRRIEFHEVQVLAAP